MLVQMLPISLQLLIARHEKKLRFLIAGGVNTLVGLSVYPLLYLWSEPTGMGYLAILFIASIISVSFSFASNKYFVFKTKGNAGTEYIKFFSFYGFYFLLNLICLPIFVEFLKISPIISQTSFSILIIATSYFWHNFITFKKTKEVN